MKLLNIQGLIITNPLNIRYIIGIPVEGTVIINKLENIFVTDARYIEEVNNFLTINDGFIVYDSKDLNDIDYFGFFADCENVGFEENYVTFHDYQNLLRKYRIKNIEETENIIEKQRMIKDEKEIEYIKKACHITDECFTYLTNFIKIGMTEKQISLEIEKYFLEHGADGLAFETIVASGVNSSKPHAIPSDKIIRYGDPITIDFGAKYNGYCSDMTRTIFAGYIPVQVQKIYDLVLKNELQTLKEYKDGASIRIVSKMVENDFRLNGYDLIHSLGHGLGLDIHEIPFINGKIDNTLKTNMVVTNEPGIYIPGNFGVRKEDTVLITKSGCINLTKSDKNYIIVDDNT